MKNFTVVIILFLFILPVFSEEELPDIKQADEYYSQGKIKEAEEIYNPLCQKDPKNYDAQMGHSRCALIMNHLGCAFRYSKNASELKPAEREPKEILAAVYYRTGKFDKAAELFKELGKESLSKKLAGFQGTEPYKPASEKKETTIKLESIESYPIIKVTVNGKHEGRFILDTGVSETVIEKSFSKKIKAETYGTDKDILFNEKDISFEHGKIKSLKVGEITLEEIPVYVMDFNQLPLKALSKDKIDGIIGYGFLSNFIVSIFPSGNEITFKMSTTQEEYTAFNDSLKSGNYKSMGFFLAPGNEMLTPVKMNGEEIGLLKVDTSAQGSGVVIGWKAAEQIGLESELKMKGTTYHSDIQKTIIAETVSTGEYELKKIETTIRDYSIYENKYSFAINGLISWNYFKGKETVFDFIGMRILINNQ
ncbi:MAG: aspartyl protease family protein [bacterium]|nr:aspartyl protease family protein [bacterium]